MADSVTSLPLSIIAPVITPKLTLGSLIIGEILTDDVANGNVDRKAFYRCSLYRHVRRLSKP